MSRDFETMRRERGWPTPDHMRRTADALDMLVVAKYGDVLRWFADGCDAYPEAGEGALDVKRLARAMFTASESLLFWDELEEVGRTNWRKGARKIAVEYSRLRSGSDEGPDSEVAEEPDLSYLNDPTARVNEDDVVWEREYRTKPNGTLDGCARCQNGLHWQCHGCSCPCSDSPIMHIGKEEEWIVAIRRIGPYWTNKD